VKLLGLAMDRSADSAEAVPGRRMITVGLMMAMAVIAVEVTVVVTALPTVIGELRGLELYPWVFSAYLLTSTVTVPIFGKLADLYGRKPIFLGGMAVFLLGSVLCGLAVSMPLLVGFRALQGLGAGALGPLVFTIIGDIYPLRERGKIQGLMSSLWAAASLAGPGLGAFLTLTLSWRWVFFVSLPFGIFATWLICRSLREDVERRSVAVDYLGAFTISAGLLGLLLLALEGGRGLGWGSPAMLGLLALSLGLLVAFIAIERRAADPLLPLSLFEIPMVAVASFSNLLQGVLLFAVTAYIPLYIQGVRGENAAGAGAALTPLLLGWALSATAGPRVLLRFGFRPTALLGTGLVLAGSLPLLALNATSPPLLIVLSMVLLGTGFGPSITTFLVAVQETVPWKLRGVATSSMQLFRSLGGTVGVALLGALLNSRLRASLPDGAADSAALLNAGARDAMSSEALAALQGSLADALQPVFLALVAVAGLSLAVALLYARNDPRHSTRDDVAGQTAFDRA
jgi:EmrB/QacA subfamily drug resistance transporter